MRMIRDVSEKGRQPKKTNMREHRSGESRSEDSQRERAPRGWMDQSQTSERDRQMEREVCRHSWSVERRSVRIIEARRGGCVRPEEKRRSRAPEREHACSDDGEKKQGREIEQMPQG